MIHSATSERALWDGYPRAFLKIRPDFFVGQRNEIRSSSLYFSYDFVVVVAKTNTGYVKQNEIYWKSLMNSWKAGGSSLDKGTKLLSRVREQVTCSSVNLLSTCNCFYNSASLIQNLMSQRVSGCPLLNHRLNIPLPATSPPPWTFVPIKKSSHLEITHYKEFSKKTDWVAIWTAKQQ